MVSSRDIKQRGNTVVNPKFSLPPGVIDVDYEDPGPIVDFQTIPDSPVVIDGSLDSDPSTGQDDSSDIEDTSNLYIPPTTISVVSQTVRILPDGSHVVDVLFDIPEDDLGSEEFDVRLSKL